MIAHLAGNPWFEDLNFSLQCHLANKATQALFHQLHNRPGCTSLKVNDFIDEWSAEK